MKIGLFDELFSCYYSTIYHVLKEATNKKLTDTELRKIVSKASDYYGFPITTRLIVERAIGEGKSEDAHVNKDAWPFFDRVKDTNNHANGNEAKESIMNKSRLSSISDIPLSRVEKMWLKSILSDPRIKLFMEEETAFPDLKDVEPLFDWNDFVLFDKYSDGDPYQDEHYIEMFRKVLKAVRNHSRLEIKFRKANNILSFIQEEPIERMIGTIYIDADYLEYSERDDKFRLIGNNPRFGRNMVNIASIACCNEVEKIVVSNVYVAEPYSRDDLKRQAVFELVDEYNSLERFLFNFSHYEKETEYLKKEKRYRITITYDETDETDLLIRTLSFGPYVKCLEPEHFVGLLCDRLQEQLRLMK